MLESLSQLFWKEERIDPTGGSKIQPTSLKRWMRLVGVVFFTFCAIFFRFISLKADPDWRLDWSTGLFTDEAYYFTNARNLVLFGQTRLDEFNNMVLSPLLHLVQEGLFRLFGVSYEPVRAMTAVCGLLAAFFLGLAFNQVMGKRAGWLAFLFLAFDHAFLLYNRIALIETPIAMVLCLAVYTWAISQKAKRQVIPLVLTGALVAIAVTTKFSAAVILPGFFLALLCIKGQKYRPILWLGLGFIVVFAIWHFAWSQPNHTELTRMVHHYRYVQLQPHSMADLLRNINLGLFGQYKGWAHFHIIHQPILFALCLFGFFMLLNRKKQLCENDGIGLLMAGWLLGGWLLMSVINYSPTRYYVVYLPAIAGFSAWVLLRALSWWQKDIDKKFPRLAFLAPTAIILFLLINIGWLTNWYTHRTYQMETATKWMQDNMKNGDVVVGDCAPPLCAETQIQSVLVSPGLCNWPYPIERFNATYVTMLGDGVQAEEWWRRGYPDLIQPANVAHIFQFGKYKVSLYKIPPQGPGRNRTEQAWPL
jgi:hypothetical protein